MWCKLPDLRSFDSEAIALLKLDREVAIEWDSLEGIVCDPHGVFFIPMFLFRHSEL